MQTNKELTILIDYLEISFPEIKNPKVLVNKLEPIKLKVNEFNDKISGKLFYNMRATYNNVIDIYYNAVPSNQHGVILELTGSGCRYIENWFTLNNSKTTWKSFLEVCLSLGGEIRRIDLVLDEIIKDDDTAPMLDLDVIGRHLKDGNYRSRKRKYEVLDSGDSYNNKEIKGKTIYLGTRGYASKSYFRFYNKKAERESNSPKEVKDIFIWQRYEMELRSNASHEVVIDYINGKELKIICLGIFKDTVSFLIRNDKNKQKHRWKVTDWWLEFLDNVESYKFTTKPRIPTEKNQVNFLVKSTSKLLTKFYLKYGDDFIQYLLNEGFSKIRDEIHNEISLFSLSTDSYKAEPKDYSFLNMNNLKLDSPYIKPIGMKFDSLNLSNEEDTFDPKIYINEKLNNDHYDSIIYTEKKLGELIPHDPDLIPEIKVEIPIIYI